MKGMLLATEKAMTFIDTLDLKQYLETVDQSVVRNLHCLVLYHNHFCS